eukprot:4290098-Pyramimonas_sp.AAC.1
MALAMHRCRTEGNAASGPVPEPQGTCSVLLAGLLYQNRSSTRLATILSVILPAAVARRRSSAR